MPTLFVMVRSIDRLHADALSSLSRAAVAMGFDRLRRLYG